MAVMVVLMSRVGLRAAVLNAENRVREIRAEKEMVLQEITELELEVTRLRAGSRIKRIAQEEIGLVMPEGAPESLY
jgi:cell division protein FtsL